MNRFTLICAVLSVIVVAGAIIAQPLLLVVAGIIAVITLIVTAIGVSSHGHN